MISESNGLRLFVAVDMPEEHKTALLKAQKAFPGLPWISARQIHLTMRFIGEVDVDQFDRVTGCLNDISASPFTLRPDGTGFFPDAAKPSIFWFGLHESAPLLDLKQKADAVLKSAIGLTPETRGFVPHVTLLRFKSHPDNELVTSLTAKFSSLGLPEFNVSSFSLYSSQLSNSGAVYVKEAEYKL
ncbi:MAG: RNA 2',3'-cyclic phosphodiesterase [Victivallaceae bacterium]|jgi:2'-5' RNA ligase